MASFKISSSLILLTISAVAFLCSSSSSAAFVKKTISSHSIVIFSKSYCPYCKRAKAVFKELKKKPYGIDQREADLIYLRERYNRLTDGSEEKAQLLVQITDITNHRAHLASSIDKIGSRLFGPDNGNSVLGYIRDQGLPVVDDWGCLKSTVRTFETHCGILTDYGMKYMRAFANVCNNGVGTSAIEEATKEACKGYNLGQWDPANRGYSA